MGKNRESRSRGMHSVPKHQFSEILNQMENGDFDNWGINTHADNTDDGFDGQAIFGNVPWYDIDGVQYYSTGLNFKSNQNKVLLNQLLNTHSKNINELILDEASSTIFVRYNKFKVDPYLNRVAFEGRLENLPYTYLKKTFN